MINLRKDIKWRRPLSLCVMILTVCIVLYVGHTNSEVPVLTTSVEGNRSLTDDWIIHLHDFTRTTGPKSQGAQDFYLYSIFGRIGTTNRYFVEFGFNEPSYTSGGSGANTRNLFDHGWRGLLLDAERENLDINLRKHYLYSNNIKDVLESYFVPYELDFLSCDMDSHDLFVLDAILEGGFRPRVMTTEFNSNYPLGLSITQTDPTLEATGADGYSFTFKQCAWGASATAIHRVATKYGYTLIGRIGYLDLVWLRNDLVHEHWTVPEFSWFFDDGMGRLHHAKQTSNDIFEYLMDYDVYLSTGDILEAKRAAKAVISAANLECFNSLGK